MVADHKSSDESVSSDSSLSPRQERSEKPCVVLGSLKFWQQTKALSGFYGFVVDDAGGRDVLVQEHVLEPDVVIPRGLESHDFRCFLHP